MTGYSVADEATLRYQLEDALRNEQRADSRLQTMRDEVARVTDENRVLRGIVARMRQGWRVSKFDTATWYRTSGLGKGAAKHTVTEPMTAGEAKALGLVP